jgi:YHS domain-containing protein
MKLTQSFIAVVMLAFGSAFAEEALNAKDPISGDPVNPAIKSTYSKTVEFCCSKCKGKFDLTPKAYMAAIKSARRGQCPLSNKASVSGNSSLYKREVAFSSAANKAKFDAAPDQYIANVR